MTPRRNLLGLFVATAMLGLLGACTNAHKVDGKVVMGRTGVVTIAAADDPRLDTEGVADVRIRLHVPGEPNTPAAEATSDAEGRFTLSLSEGVLYGGRTEIIATGEGVLSCRGSLYVPRDGRWVLVFVEPTGDSAR